MTKQQRTIIEKRIKADRAAAIARAVDNWIAGK